MNQPQPSSTTFSWSFLGAVLGRGLLLFVAFNLLFGLLYPVGLLGRISLYNLAFPGRERLPFGENPAKAYNLSLYNLEAMFASLRLNGAAARPADEYRVLVIGDSSVWGTLLRPEDTLAGQLDTLGIACGGRRVRVYNLGYPTLSVTKDLMILEEALRRYQPDRILWLVTLEGLPVETQVKSSPLLANNPQRAENLARTYSLPLDRASLSAPSFWDRTLVGARRPLADLVRLQLYGALWGATRIDQTYPEKYEPAARDLAADLSFHGRQPPSLDPASLALDVLAAGNALAGSVPVTFINEPMLVSSGKNSAVRYNFFYPRWAYDQYRQILADYMKSNNLDYQDYWNLVTESQFTNSAIHLTPVGERLLAERVSTLLQTTCQASRLSSYK